MTNLRDRNVYTYVEDDFDRAVEFGEEGHGTIPQVKELSVISEWEQLSRGKTLGKSVGVAFVSGATGVAGNNMFEIRSINDDSAMPLLVALSPPKVNVDAITSSLAANISGTANNQQQNLIAGLFAFANPFARIEWGLGGILNQCDVDVHNGASLMINASFVRISAFVADAVVPVSTAGYQISAFVGPGQGKYLGAQRTLQCPIPFPAIGAESASFPVPLFARRVRLSGALAVIGGAFSAGIRFYRDRAGALPVAEYLFANTTPDSFYIPNGAYYFRYVGTVAGYSSINAIFDLAI